MKNHLASLLRPENVRIISSVRNWEEAIEESTRPLVEQGYVTPDYPKQIIALTQAHGAYYVLGEDVALVHARPDSGVIKEQLAVTVIKQPVIFEGKESEPVRLFIAMAAESSSAHLEMMRELAKIVIDTERVKKMCRHGRPSAAL